MDKHFHNIVILNGPNLNLLGLRELEIYGSQSFDDFFSELRGKFPKLNLAYEQHNSEGDMIEAIHEYGLNGWAIVINPGAFTHASIGIRDALLAVQTPCIEVHISDITKREQFRQHSTIQDIVHISIVGKGLLGYKEAIEYFMQ